MWKSLGYGKNDGVVFGYCASVKSRGKNCDRILLSPREHEKRLCSREKIETEIFMTARTGRAQI